MKIDISLESNFGLSLLDGGRQCRLEIVQTTLLPLDNCEDFQPFLPNKILTF
jgi:hypothetical protein